MRNTVTNGLKVLLSAVLFTTSVGVFANSHTTANTKAAGEEKAKEAASQNLPAYAVRPITAYVGEYRDKRRIVLEAIEKLPANTPISERLAIYEREINVLKEQFRKVRRQEYESKSYEGSAGHSCTKGSSGGKKDCGWKCVNSPTSDLYTTPGWIRVAGDDKGTRVTSGQACLRMTRAGKGRNAGTLYATFKYNPAVVEKRLYDEVLELFERIGQHDPT